MGSYVKWTCTPAHLEEMLKGDGRNIAWLKGLAPEEINERYQSFMPHLASSFGSMGVVVISYSYAVQEIALFKEENFLFKTISMAPDPIADFHRRLYPGLGSGSLKANMSMSAINDRRSSPASVFGMIEDWRMLLFVAENKRWFGKVEGLEYARQRGLLKGGAQYEQFMKEIAGRGSNSHLASPDLSMFMV